MSNQAPKKLKRLSPRENNDRAVRILYVEDAEVIRDTMSRLLELNGYQVAYAKNGKEGVDMVRRWKPDIILMDLRMPIMDGYGAIAEIKQDPTTRHIPIFVISAWSSKTDQNKAKVAGADKFFVKPPDLNKLIEAINQALGLAPKA